MAECQSATVTGSQTNTMGGPCLDQLRMMTLNANGLFTVTPGPEDKYYKILKAASKSRLDDGLVEWHVQDVEQGEARYGLSVLLATRQDIPQRVSEFMPPATREVVCCATATSSSQNIFRSAARLGAWTFGRVTLSPDGRYSASRSTRSSGLSVSMWSLSNTISPVQDADYTPVW